MKEFWNERYSQPEYVYGLEPNEFFRQQLDRLPAGKILLPGEGEGRNAVYAALQGWQVTAFDYSEAAMNKALRLAHDRNVKLNYFLSDYHAVDLKASDFDVVALIFTHTPNWEVIFPSFLRFLRDGGIFMAELFNTRQIANSSGGPKNPEMLINADELYTALGAATSISTWEERINLAESRYHEGTADVTRCVAVK